MTPSLNTFRWSMSSADRSSHPAGSVAFLAGGTSGAFVPPLGERAGISLQEPSIIGLLAQGADSADKNLLLAIIAALLTSHGFDATSPVDRLSNSLDVVLPRNWRELPIARDVAADRLPDMLLPTATFPRNGERAL